MPTLLALLSSLSWGTADFIGGQLSRRHPALFVVGVSQAFGLVTMVVVATASGSWSQPLGYLPWSVLASVTGFTGLGMFYRAMATGAVGVVSPITALAGVGPVMLGLARGERPTTLQFVGLFVALVGVVLASGPELSGRDGSRGARPVLLAITATVMFGVCLSAIAIGSEYSAVMTMTGMRAVTVLALSGLAALLLLRGHRRGAPGRRDLLAMATVGVLDVSANLLFGIAAVSGVLALVSILGSLYPIVTVLLAWWLLGERLAPVQYWGVGLALGGVAAIVA